MPVLRRPHRVRPFLDSLYDTTDGCRVVFLTDADDKPERRAIRQCGAEDVPCGGNYAAKINAGVRLTDEPLIFLAADDLHFHAGWLEAALAELSSSVGVVGTNDLCNARTMRGDHSTHSLVTRQYAQRGTIDEPDKLLHEGYPHEYVDDEFVQTAMRRGAYAHALDSIVEHLHPNVGKAPLDDLYAAQRTRMKIGRRIYRQRQKLWT